MTGVLAVLVLVLVAGVTGLRVNIEDFGAKGDNKTDNTAAIRKALKAAAGGTVVVPAGGVYLSAPVNLTSSTTLEVNGVLRSVVPPTGYPLVAPLPSYGYSRDVGYLRYHPFIWAVNQSNVKVNGSGTIDGAGAVWWAMYHNKELKSGRPHLMEFNGCEGVEVSGVTLKDSGFWTLHPVYCSGVWIHHIAIEAPWPSPNTDGVDPDSSSDVLIEDCTINCGDDHFAIKSGMDAPGLSYGRPSRNITIRRNTLRRGMGISMGSECSGGIEDVVIEGNNLVQSTWGNGFLLKTAPSRGGYFRNIRYVNNTLVNITAVAMSISTSYTKGTPPPSGPTKIENITYQGIHGANARVAGSFECFEELPCKGLTFADISLTGVKEWKCSHVASYSVSGAISPPGLLDCLEKS